MKGKIFRISRQEFTNYERPNIRNEKFYVLRPETSYPCFQEYVRKFSRLLKRAIKAWIWLRQVD